MLIICHLTKSSMKNILTAANILSESNILPQGFTLLAVLYYPFSQYLFWTPNSECKILIFWSEGNEAAMFEYLDRNDDVKSACYKSDGLMT